jgi:hypothetical protein
VSFEAAAADPLTVIIGANSTIYAVVGNAAVLVVYLLVADILSIFTVGFVVMSRHIVNSGAVLQIGPVRDVGRGRLRRPRRAGPERDVVRLRPGCPAMVTCPARSGSTSAAGCPACCWSPKSPWC